MMNQKVAKLIFMVMAVLLSPISLLVFTFVKIKKFFKR